MQTHRYPLYHAKDGDATTEPVGVGNGYTMVPFGDPAATSTTRRSTGSREPRVRTNSKLRSRTTPPAATGDPGQSLRFARISAAGMAALRR